MVESNDRMKEKEEIKLSEEDTEKAKSKGTVKGDPEIEF